MGKLVFDEKSIFDMTGKEENYSMYIDYGVRIIAFILMLNFNKLMLKFMFNSL